MTTDGLITGSDLDRFVRLADDRGLPALLGDPGDARDVVAQVIRRGGSPRTVDGYAKDLALYGRWLREHELTWRDVGPKEIDAYAWWLRDHWALSTARRRMAVVRDLYAEAHRLGLRDRSETQAPAILRGDTSNPTPSLTLDETRILFARLEALVAEQRGTGRLDGLRDRALVSLLFLSGLRRQELADARVSDLQRVQGYDGLRVIGKGRKAHTVKIVRPGWLDAWQDAVRDAWRGIVAQAEHDMAGGQAVPTHYAWSLPWLAVARDGALPSTVPLFLPLDRWGHLRGLHALDGSTIRLILLRRLAQAGVQAERDETNADERRKGRGITVHSARATYITLAIRAGVPLPTVQASVAHADPRQTAKYASTAQLLEEWPGDAIRL